MILIKVFQIIKRRIRASQRELKLNPVLLVTFVETAAASLMLSWMFRCQRVRVRLKLRSDSQGASAPSQISQQISGPLSVLMIFSESVNHAESAGSHLAEL